MMRQRTIVEEGIEELERYNKAIEGNKSYVAKKLAQDPDYFKKLAKGQNPKYLLIGCSDSRAPPNELTETDPGDIFIHRNIANLVIPTDLNLNCVIQYAVEHLKVHNIVIMGHTCCGGVKAAMQQESVGGLLDLWLNQIKMVYEKHQDVVNSFEQEDDRINSLCCINVREQVMNIWKNPMIQKSWDNGHPVMVHGWLFRVETGLIEEVSLDESIPHEMSKIFKLKFKPTKQEDEHEHQEHSQGPPTIRRRLQRMQSRLETQVKMLTMKELDDLSQINLDEIEEIDNKQQEKQHEKQQE